MAGPSPIDLSPYLGKAKQRIYRVGIELEGGWKKLPPGVPALTRDTSVHVMLGVDGIKHVGELPSPLLDVSDVPVYLEKFYPHKVDRSCGMHVHMSFITAANYQRLMTPEILPTTVKYITDWAYKQNLPPTHPIWGRLRGDCEYCQHKFFAEEQTKHTGKQYNRTERGHRYTMWNFCYSRIGTAECRLLPMFDTHTQAASAIQELVQLTNAFLLSQAKKNKVVSKVEDDGTVEREEVIEVM